MISGLTIFQQKTQQYVQTSTRNLRCFPHCCKGHMEKSFCGADVEVLVADINFNSGNVLFFGEIVKTNTASFQIGDSCLFDDVFSSPKYFTGHLASYERNPTGARFRICPKRKWGTSHLDLAENSYQFIAYLVIDSKVTNMISSPVFTVNKWIQPKRARPTSSSKRKTTVNDVETSKKCKLEFKERKELPPRMWNNVSPFHAARVVLPFHPISYTLPNYHPTAYNMVLPHLPPSVMFGFPPPQHSVRPFFLNKQQ